MKLTNYHYPMQIIQKIDILTYTHSKTQYLDFQRLIMMKTVFTSMQIMFNVNQNFKNIFLHKHRHLKLLEIFGEWFGNQMHQLY